MNSLLGIGRVTPHAVNIEQNVLGNLINTPGLFEELNELLVEGIFYKEEHNIILEAMRSLSSRNQDIDILSVSDELSKEGKLEEVGGNAYMISLEKYIFGVSNVRNHVRLLLEKMILRRMIGVGHEVQVKGYDQDLSSLLVYVDDQMQEIHRIIGGDHGGKDIKGVLKDVSEVIDRRIDNFTRGEIEGISSGLRGLDKLTNGWTGGSLCILAGRPSMGKTAVAVSWVIQALKDGYGVLVFSLEMTSAQFIERMLYNITPISPFKFKDGSLTVHDRHIIGERLGTIANWDLEIDDRSGINPMMVRSKVRNFKAKHEKCLVVIDYVNRMEYHKRTNNREDVIGSISNSLKDTAKDFDVPILLLAQLNRDVDKRAGGRPIMSDLRESGRLEQDADMVMFCYRPWWYGITVDPETSISTKGMGIIIVAKNRLGGVGDVYFKHGIAVAHIKDHDEYESYIAEHGVYNDINELPDDDKSDFDVNLPF